MSTSIIDTSVFKNGDFKLHILNEKNILITKDFIHSIFKKYNFNYHVKKLENFQLAMIHVSYMSLSFLTEKTAKILRDVPSIDNNVDLSKIIPLQDTNYGVLEFKGDAILHHILADYLYERYPNEHEGFLTKMRTKIEKGETLSKLSQIIELNKYAVIARNIEYANGRKTNVHLTEDIFEAFFGALSLETNYENCYKLFINIIEQELDFAELLHIDDNYKDKLMQYYHKNKWTEPKYYEELSNSQNRTNADHVYIIYVKDNNGKIISQGKNNVKSKAEQEAAKNALEHLNVINDNSDCASDYFGELESQSESESDEYIMS